MGGIFGAVSKTDITADLFFGTDYHTHLGARRGGMAVYAPETGFQRAIHNIENAPFRTKFGDDMDAMHGNMGIGCISDTDPQPVMVRSHLGSYALTTVGRINNAEELVEDIISRGGHFNEQSGGQLNPTELVASLINQCDTIAEGIRYAQKQIDGSMTLLLMTKDGLYAARDYHGRTPLILGHKEGAYCAAFESFSYMNLGYRYVRDLGPGEIVFMTPDSCETLKEPNKKMKICAFLWIYYGYTTSCYEGVNVEVMRNNCGALLARRDKGIDVDYVAGVPESGNGHAIGYANESGIKFARPFIKYTPTWVRSFTPAKQSIRDLTAHMKLIPVEQLIRGKKLLFLDDSVVRGTQMRNTVEFLYNNGAKEVHIRSASPPSMFGCKYLNFSPGKSDMDLIARQVVRDFDGDDRYLKDYCTDNTERYHAMVEQIARRLNFTSLKYHLLADVKTAVGIDPDSLCTYCFTGEE
ncbi:MAG: amidophosphoribosyltransferase [Oscillospiraceae bacterium]|nr:amidophosphoribosyltransferase [Oscillospiraceae bacterium]